MKKILTVLFTCLLVIFSASAISAGSDHIIIGKDGEGIIDAYEESRLEDDLDHIRDDYGIDIYFIFDASISDVQQYAINFIYDVHNSENTVVLCMNDEYYDIEALGPQQDLIYANSSDLFNTFYNAVSTSSGIEEYYKKVVRIVNSEAYTSSVDTVSGTPAFVDLADLLSSSEESDITSRLNELYNKYGIKVVAVTTNTLHGMTPQDYADDFYDYNGYPNDGVLFLLSMEDRDWYVSTRGKGARNITEFGVDLIADEMMSSLKKGDYYGAFKKYASKTDYLLGSAAKGKVVDGYTEPQKESEREFGAGNIGIGVGIGAIISFITTLIFKGQLKSVHKERYARNYVVDGSFYLNGYADQFINRSVSRSPRPKNDDSGSHSGGGTSYHTSSSGISHGGHGGKF